MTPLAQPGELRVVELDWLVPAHWNPRGPVDTKSAAFAELVASVKAVGILQPPVVRRMPTTPAAIAAATAYAKARGPVPKGQSRAYPDASQLLQVLCGARRVAAAHAAGLLRIAVLVCDLDDKRAMEVTFVENFERENLRPLQEARGIAAMREVGWTDEAIAERIGKTPAWVARRAKLLHLSNEWQALFADERGPFALWPAGVQESIARLPAGAQQAAFATLEGMDSFDLEDELGYDGLVPTVAEFDKWAARTILHTLGGATFDLADATLDAKAGPCTTCPKRASQERLLFEELLPAGGKALAIKQDRCLDAACFAEKTSRGADRTLATLKSTHGTALPLIARTGYMPDVQALRKRWPGAAFARECETVKAGTPGAVPGVIIDGDAERGSTIWVKPRGDASAAAKTAAAAIRKDTPKAAAAAVTPLKERRAALDNRRRALALEKLRAALLRQAATLAKEKPAQFAVEFTDELVQRIGPAMSLAAVFGTETRADDRGVSDWAALWKEYEETQKGNGGAWLMQAARRLACEVIPVLVKRLDPWGGLESVEKVWPHAQRVAGIFKIPIDRLWSDAVLEIKEPASWAREEHAAKARKSGQKKAVRR